MNAFAMGQKNITANQMKLKSSSKYVKSKGINPSKAVPQAVSGTGSALIKGGSSSETFPLGGGSNMVFLDLGIYQHDKTRFDDVKVTLLHYEKYRDLAKQRLKEMRSNGQTKISVVLWYVEDGANCTINAHVVCPQNGQVPDQVKENIKNFITDVNAAQFDTFVLRFATQGAADPLGDNYQIHRIEDSWKLYDNVITLAESAAKNTNLRMLYDLGLELMGQTKSNKKTASDFFYAIWGRYTAKYPAEKSLGFSFNHAQSKVVKDNLDVYNNVGKWPAAIAIDIYEKPSTYLGNLASGLKWARKSDHPIVILETLYNNKGIADELRNAKAKTKLNFQFITQWPLANIKVKHTEDAHTPLINNYVDVSKVAAPVIDLPIAIQPAITPVPVSAAPPAPTVDKDAVARAEAERLAKEAAAKAEAHNQEIARQMEAHRVAAARAEQERIARENQAQIEAQQARAAAEANARAQAEVYRVIEQQRQAELNNHRAEEARLRALRAENERREREVAAIRAEAAQRGAEALGRAEAELRRQGIPAATPSSEQSINRPLRVRNMER